MCFEIVFWIDLLKILDNINLEGENMDELKKFVGVIVVKYVKNGMIVGLGIGFIVYFFVEEIGCCVKEEGL